MDLEGRIFMCNLCEYSTEDKPFLIEHVKSVHDSVPNNFPELEEAETESPIVVHDNDNSVVDDSTEAESEIEETDEVLKCSECGFKTKYAHNLKRHARRTHHGQEDAGTELKCKECDYVAKKSSILKKHVKGVHRQTELFACGESECEFRTKWRYNLKAHKKAIHGIEKEEEVKIAEETEDDDESEEGKERFSCRECDFKTLNKKNLSRHVKKTHGFTQEYSCIQCEFQTNRHQALRDHVKAAHAKEKHINCQKCSFVTNNQRNLLRHQRNRHNNNNNNIPAKPTKSKSPKINAIKSVSTDCSKCSYVARDKFRLSNHFQTVHVKNGEKPLRECQMCDYKIANPASFNKHVRETHVKTELNKGGKIPDEDVEMVTEEEEEEEIIYPEEAEFKLTVTISRSDWDLIMEKATEKVASDLESGSAQVDDVLCDLSGYDDGTKSGFVVCKTERGANWWQASIEALRSGFTHKFEVILPKSAANRTVFPAQRIFNLFRTLNSSFADEIGEIAKDKSDMVTENVERKLKFWGNSDFKAWIGIDSVENTISFVAGKVTIYAL